MSALPAQDAPELANAAVGWLRDLVRLDTTNLPGNETPAARYLAELLRANGLEPEVVEPSPGRGSVVARLRGTGQAAPLLLTGHLDVVEAGDGWTHPPFAGVIDGGMLWGRGALDCKAVVVQALATLIRLARSGIRPPRDVIFAAVADEERGGHLGAGWLVDHRPELVRAEYALGEIGGIGRTLLGRRIHPIQVAEKGSVKLRLVVRAQATHGALPGGPSAIRAAARVVQLLSPGWWHRPLTPAVRDALARLKPTVPWPARAALSLLDVPVAGTLLRELAVCGKLGPVLRGVLCDTLVFTGVDGRGSSNTAPAQVELLADGRLLPGTSPDAFVDLVKRRVRGLAEVQVLSVSTPVETTADGSLFEALARELEESEPGSLALPYLMPGGTDAKAFARLGTRWFGFSPIDTRDCPGLDLYRLYHATDERVPVDGFRAGVELHARAVARFLGSGTA